MQLTLLEQVLRPSLFGALSSQAHSCVILNIQEMFALIKPTELLFGNAGKKNKHELAPHVMRLVEWFNRIVAWVASAIVLTSNIKERRLVIKRFLEIADVRELSAEFARLQFL